MCKSDMLHRIDELTDDIEKAESAISNAQYELSNLKDEVHELSEDDHHDLLSELYLFITSLEEKTRPCRIKYIVPIYSEDDHEVVTGMDTTYFDWGFEAIIARLKGVL